MTLASLDAHGTPLERLPVDMTALLADLAPPGGVTVHSSCGGLRLGEGAALFMVTLPLLLPNRT
ncbi:MAG TPA: hypothetical protein VJ870_00855 [Amycolatopsis sp.]|nr:hypothetical protein [Amycolatopsis sp.]